MRNPYYLSSLTLLFTYLLYITDLQGQEPKQRVLPPIEKAQANQKAGNISLDTNPNEKEEKKLKSKEFTFQFEGNSITSSLEIIQTNIEARTCKGLLSIKKVQPLIYKGFVLPGKTQGYYNYTLSLKGSQFSKSEIIPSGDIEKGISTEFNFEYIGHFEHLYPYLELTAKSEQDITTKNAVDEYYKATDELNTLTSALKKISFSTEQYLTPTEKELEYIKESLQKINSSEFLKILPLKETDPAGYMQKQIIAQELTSQKETECFNTALTRANDIESSLKSMRFQNPDSLEYLKSRLTRNISNFDDISNLIINLNRQKVKKIEVLLEKMAKINEQLLIKKDELESALSKKHISYYELGLKQKSNDRKREYFEKAILFAPQKFPEPYYQIALIDFNEGSYNETLAALDEAVKSFPFKEDYHSLYWQVFEKYMYWGDQAKESETALSFYLEAKKVCSNRTWLSFSCEKASQKISNIHANNFEKITSQGLKYENYDKIKESKEYFLKYQEFFIENRSSQIDQAFLSLQEASLNRATVLFNEEKLKEAQALLKTIKEKERKYLIISNNSYNEEWKSLAKKIFSESLLYVSTDNSSDLNRSKQLIELCNEMAKDLLFKALFSEYDPQLRTLTIRIYKKYFYESLAQVDEELNKEEINRAIRIVENAKKESSMNNEWFGEDEKSYLNIQEEKTYNAAFYYHLNKADEWIKSLDLEKSKKGINDAGEYLKKIEEGKRHEKNKLLDDVLEKYNKERIKLKYKEINRLVSSQLVSLGGVQEEYFKKTIDELLGTIKLSKDSTRTKPLLDSLQQTANVIGKEALIFLKSFYEGNNFGEALWFAEEALRLDTHLSDSISSELRVVIENCLRQESKEILKYYYTKKPDKATKEKLKDLNKRIDKYFKPNEGHALPKVIDEIIREINTLEIFYSMNDRILDLYQKRDYESMLNEYLLIQEFYMTHKLSEQGMSFSSLENFVNEKKDRYLLEYIIIKKFLTPEYHELIPSLLISLYNEHPDSIKEIGAKIGREINKSGTIKGHFLDIPFNKTLPKKALKELKKGMKKGMK